LFSGREYLRIEWDRSLDVSGGFTIAVWVRLDRDLDGIDACAVTEPNLSEPGGNSYSLCVFARNRAVYDDTTSAGHGDSQRLTDPLAIKEWHHLAMTWDAASMVKALYVDGNRMDTRNGIDIGFDHAPVAVEPTWKASRTTWLLPGSGPAHSMTCCSTRARSMTPRSARSQRRRDVATARGRRNVPKQLRLRGRWLAIPVLLIAQSASRSSGPHHPNVAIVWQPIGATAALSLTAR
jgi:hypothetical protein